MKLTTLVRLILVAAMTAASLAIPGAASGCPCCDRLAADQAAASNDCCRMEPDRPHHAAVLGRAAQPVFTPQAPGGLSGHRLSADIVLVPVAGTVRSARDAYLRNSVLRI